MVARYVKFNMGIDHNLTYKFWMKFCLQVNSYEHDDNVKLKVVSYTFNIESVLRYIKFFQKRIY
jgi:hypothetical protein